MYFIQEIFDKVYWVGVNDRRIERFENMFLLKKGVAYNSYLIRDEKTLLMDCVDGNFAQQFLDNVEGALDGRDLDYLVVNHMEPDHCGTIKFILNKYPNCKFVGNKKTFQFFEQFYDGDYSDRYYEVKENDEINIGSHNFKFVFAPMVHWPEVMMVYETNNSYLFSADAFGAFDAHEGSLFAKDYYKRDNWINEARRYYINIVGKHGNMVMNVFKKIENLPIKAIMSLHGPVYSDEESINFILDKYKTWASFKPEKKGVLIAFSSMYGNLALASDILANELSKLGVTDISMFDVSNTDYGYIISDAHKYSHAVFTPMNYNAELYPKMDALLRELVSTGYKNRHISLLNSWSWCGNSLKIAQDILSKGNHTYVGDVVKIKSSVKEENLSEIKALAKAIKEDMDSLD
ncbi:MAG: FprA family A-type flavoprotein [Tissierellia bacterium]|nr:FprA family A-type flavoprotein [Tissierellia bacterium]